MNRELLKEVLYLIESWQRGAYADEYFEIDGVIDAINAQLAKPKLPNAFREVLVGNHHVLRFYPSDTGWMCGISNAMMDAIEELAKPEQDWDLLAKTQESLREHMARIKELEARLATQTALDKKADNARELGLDYEPEQKPVAWMMPEYGDVLPASQADGTGIYNIPLYTSLPRKEWVGLTDKEEIELDEKTWLDINAYLEARDAKLKEKNNAV